MVAQKRQGDALALVPTTKRFKNDIAVSNSKSKAIVPSIQRTSNLFAPNMILQGHEGEIFTLDFHPEGQYIASSGFDRKIFIWSVYGECENVSVMSGHTGSLMELHFTRDGSHIITAGTDHMLGLWDFATGQRIKKFRGHTTFVNSVQCSRRGLQTLVSGGDDSTVRIWDVRKRYNVAEINSGYPVTAVTYNDTAEQIFSGGIDNVVKVWDTRKNEILYSLSGHTDTITGLAVSPDGSHLLSNSMDNSLRVWDIRPYAPQERCVNVFTGHLHHLDRNLLRCSWSPDGSKVSAGSSDRFVYIWDIKTRNILYKLPGHNGTVNEVRFHPYESIIASGSTDTLIYLGEIE